MRCGFVVSVLILLFTSFVVTSCLEQYNPRPDWKRFRSQRANAHAKVVSLNDDGTMPDPNAGEVIDADGLYARLCASCHGESGAGDGAGGLALDPKPRDFSDSAWQNATADDRIAKVVKSGGSSVGLNSTMAAFGGLLSDGELAALVTKVRSFAK